MKCAPGKTLAKGDCWHCERGEVLGRQPPLMTGLRWAVDVSWSGSRAKRWTGEYADVEVGQRQSREAEYEGLVAEAGAQRTQEVTGAMRLEGAR